MLKGVDGTTGPAIVKSRHKPSFATVKLTLSILSANLICLLIWRWTLQTGAAWSTLWRWKKSTVLDYTQLSHFWWRDTNGD